MTTLTRLYLAIPETPRKALRDSLAVGLAFVLASGVLDQASPNWHTLGHIVVAAAGVAGWRLVRALLTTAPVGE